MPQSTGQLNTYITNRQFDQIEKAFFNHFSLPLETLSSSCKHIKSLSSVNFQPEFCKLICSTEDGQNRCSQDRRRSMLMAFETGQPYTSFCHAGIVLVCIPVMNQNTPLGGIFFGKCMSEKITTNIIADLEKRLIGLQCDMPEIIESARKLPVIPARTIHAASEFLFIILYEMTGLDPRIIKWRRQKTSQQAKISEIIHENKKLGQDGKYPYQSERELIGKVKIGDKTGAKEILNSILGTIIFRNPGQIQVLKARLVELLGVLSRAAVEGGVDIDIMLERNLQYITNVISLDTQDDICAWISRALDDFIDSVYESQDTLRISKIKPAVDYIENHYDEKITVTRLAKISHLSESRFAHLFKEQMKTTPVEYLTSIRIRRAKQLLLSTDRSCLEICYDTGYQHPSFFAKMFKLTCGMTPMEFRKLNDRTLEPDSSV